MELPTYFKDFLSAIRPTPEEVQEYKNGHETLRAKLLADPDLAPHIVSTFLQGSYKRSTAIQPENGKRSDVDVVVVTNFSEDEYTPEQAQAKFITFLEDDDDYKDNFAPNDRSLGIDLDKVELDLVITSAPSEVVQEAIRNFGETVSYSLDETDDWTRPLLQRAATDAAWKQSPLRIPDRNLEQWQDTHPLEQLRWTIEHNEQCNTHYVNVVKALKWWRRTNFTTPKYPKGYPVEHLIGTFCPVGITSVAQGVTLTLERIAADPALQIAAMRRQTPWLSDRGVPENNVFARVTGDDFATFFEQVETAAEIARTALDHAEKYESVQEWRKLFGERFPQADPPDNDDGGARGGFTPRTQRSVPTPSRFG